MEYCNNKEENSKNKPHLIESYFTVMEVLCRPGAPLTGSRLSPRLTQPLMSTSMSQAMPLPGVS